MDRRGLRDSSPSSEGRFGDGDAEEARPDSRWIREATRLHDRYVVEIVEKYDLCPWATRARLDGRLRVHVSLQTDDAPIESPLATLERWASDGRMEVGFLLFPRLDLGRSAFESFATRVRTADTDRCPLGSAPFAMVAFHPEAAPQFDDAERLIPFLRRTPDRCIQVVRIDVLDRVRGAVPEGTQYLDVTLLETAPSSVATPSVRDRVCRANLETARSVGVDELRGALDAIREDRDATYLALDRLERGA
jgi:hypothetical protein